MILITKTSDQARQRGQTHSLYLYSSYLGPEYLVLPALLPCCSLEYLGWQRVCVCFLPIHSGHQVGHASRGHTGFFIHLPAAVRALIFLARRIQPFPSLVDCEVELCVAMI